MVAINIVTGICFALFTIEILYVLISFITKNREERIHFIRSFKKGKCLAIFLMAIPLFCIGCWFKDRNLIESFFNALSNIVNLVVLKFDFGKIRLLLDENSFYRITVYYCCVLVTLNAILFGLSLVGQRIWEFSQRMKEKYTQKDKLYIYGNNKNNTSIYCSGQSYFGMIIDRISASDRLSLYINKIRFISYNHFDNTVKTIFRCLKNKKNKITVIINTENDEKNLAIVRCFMKEIGQASDDLKQRYFELLDITIFGEPNYETIYNDIVSNSWGCVRYKNKYQMIAMKFIEEHPFTEFMDERHIDYKTSIVKNNVNMNVCMVGYGKTNQQIFLTSVANNQFLFKQNDQVMLKKVNYHLFDKNYAENNKNLNHSYYRYRNEIESMKPNEFLPLPEIPANEIYHHMDVNEPAFYSEIKKIVTSSKNDVNFIIIAFQTDLENIDMAQKLVEKRREWGVDDLVIFVKVRKEQGDLLLFKEKNVFIIGNESKSVYNINAITNDKIYRMAKMRNEIYDLEYTITTNKEFVVNAETVKANSIQANKNWFISKSPLERFSSLFCCLSLQSKLNLMGLKYCKKDENDLPALTEKEYLDYYAEGDIPDIETYSLEVEGKKIIKYPLNFKESRRKNLAILEHYRWNSFMISQGMIPASKDQILNEMAEKCGKIKHTNGKNYRLRRHGNLTTFEGLVEFRKMVANREGGNEADFDVIKYDYQILDDAYWLLSKNGYKIVKRNNEK